MKRTVWLQETRQMRFDAPHPYYSWYRREEVNAVTAG